MIMRRGIAFNGKFLSAAPTGVHRVARELIANLDASLAERADVASERSWSLVKPRDADRVMPLAVIRPRTAGVLTWQPWEQAELPLLAGTSMLVSLCNLAPVYHPGVAMIHDAQVFLSPQSYGAAFAAWYRFALPRIGRSSRLILTVSEYSRRKLVEFGVAPYEKIEVIHNGADHLAKVDADPQILDRLGLWPRAYVVALANVQKHKNIGVLLEAFGRPGLSSARLVLVGAADAQMFAGTGHPAPPNATFAGVVSDGEMRALLEQAACLAFPSTTEGFGLPPLEAMALGCPAIIAPRGALPEVCGAAAVAAEPDDATAWEAAIQMMLESADHRSHWGVLGRLQAAKFTWRASAERLSMLVRHAADA
jgi:glycosyltransferase involved in cell wall biosynthesis